MSDRGRYRKVYARLFRHPGFVGLTDAEKLLVIYLVTGPQTNRIGMYVLSIATAAEDLGSVPQTIKKRLANVCTGLGWLFDPHARVFLIPSWWRWNPPENPNVLKGSLKDLNEIPPCGLIDRFTANLTNIPETLHQTFLEGLREHLPERSPTQEQYQDLNQEQKQKPALRAKDGRDEKVSATVQAIAKQVIRDANGKTTDTDYLIDATIETCKNEKILITRTIAIAAIAAAIPEGRAL
jgi:hypothetical protein